MAPGAFDNGRQRVLVNGLWLGAALIVTVGFVLRIAASVLERSDLRLTGVVMIAVGIVVGCLGWLSERLAARLRRAR
jgi:hypothetical protein